MGAFYQTLDSTSRAPSSFAQSLDLQRRSSTAGPRSRAVATGLHDPPDTVLVQAGDYAGAQAALDEALAQREVPPPARTPTTRRSRWAALAQLVLRARATTPNARRCSGGSSMSLRRQPAGHEEALAGALNDTGHGHIEQYAERLCRSAEAAARGAQRISDRKLFAGAHPKIAQAPTISGWRTTCAKEWQTQA